MHLVSRCCYLFLLPLVGFSVVSCGTVTVTGIQDTVDCSSVTATFAADVEPIFTSRGCNNTGCHVGSGAAAGLNLDNTLSTDDLYQNLIDTGAVDPDTHPDEPLDAPIISYPLNGLDEHGEGGVIFNDLTDANLIQLYCWIDNGAGNN